MGCVWEKFLRLEVEEAAKSQSEVRELERGSESGDLKGNLVNGSILSPSGIHPGCLKTWSGFI